MSDIDPDLKQAELEEQNSVLKAALEHLLSDAETFNANIDPITVEKLEAAGYEYDPLGPDWEYDVDCTLSGTIEAHDKIHSEEDAIAIARDRLIGEISEIVLRGTQEDFLAAFPIRMRIVA